jgi:hypothetical protein
MVQLEGNLLLELVEVELVLLVDMEVKVEDIQDYLQIV